MMLSVWSHTDGRSDLSPAVRSSSTPETPPVGFMHPAVKRVIYAVLAELGADPDALLAEAALDPELFNGSSTPLPYAAFGRLITLGAERTGCRHLSLLIGQRTDLASLGPIGMLMRNSDTVGDALRALEEHVCKQNWGAVVGLGTCDGMAVLSHAPYGPEHEGAAQHSERALAAMTNVLRALSGSGWAPLEVLLPRSRPRDTIVYEHFFRAPVRFDQEAAALVFPADLLEQRIAGADLTVRQSAEDHVRQLEGDQASNLTEELRRYLRTQVTRQRCHAEQAARMRLVTRRTMSRHLKAQGTTFRRLAAEAQFQVAKQLLADTSMSVTQISTALNFSEPAAFTHAFQRWSGMTPIAWRRENQPVEAARLLSLQNSPEQPSPSSRASKPCRAVKQANLSPE